jgi:hypothetical protein
MFDKQVCIVVNNSYKQQNSFVFRIKTKQCALSSSFMNKMLFIALKKYLCGLCTNMHHRNQGRLALSLNSLKPLGTSSVSCADVFEGSLPV